VGVIEEKASPSREKRARKRPYFGLKRLKLPSMFKKADFKFQSLAVANALINGLPQVGWGGVRVTQRKFDIFRFSNVNFPNLGSPLQVKFGPLGTPDLA